MEIKNDTPTDPAPVAVCARDAKPGHVYRHVTHWKEASPYLYMRTLGGSMMSLVSGKLHWNRNPSSHEWIEVEAHVTYTGDKK